MSKRLVVVGCARSGTGYTATLLSRLGISVGHEGIFGPPDGLTPGPERKSGHDVSWLAAPHLAGLTSEWLALHQVRHPVLVARSVMGMNMFESRTWWQHHLRFWIATKRSSPTNRAGPSYVAFAHKHAELIKSERTPVDRAFRYWVEWNRLIEQHPTIRHRVEDIDRSWIEEIFQELKLPIPKGADIDDALEQNSKTANHRGLGPGIQFGDISNRKLVREVTKMAEEYGYEAIDAVRQS